MTKEEYFANVLSKWSIQDYCQNILWSDEYSAEEKIETMQALSEQHILTMCMVGNSVSGLKLTEKDYEKDDEDGIFFSEIFERVITRAEEKKELIYLTPGIFLLELNKEINKNKDNCGPNRKVELFGRALRAFASMFREWVCNLSIESLFPERFKCRRVTSEEDGNKHVDLELYDIKTSITYYLCLYQHHNPGARKHIVNKFIGNRGELNSGYYIFLPLYNGFDKNTLVKNGWWFYSDEYLMAMKDKIDSGKIDDYYEKKAMGKEELKEYLGKIRIIYKR